MERKRKLGQRDVGSAILICIFLLLVALTGCSTGRVRKAYTHYNLGVDAFYRGKLIEANDHLLKAREITSKDPDVSHMLGLVSLARWQTESNGEYLKAAETYLLDAIKYYKNFNTDDEFAYGRLSYSDAYVALSSVYLQQNRWDDAIEEAERALTDTVYRSPDKANYNIGWAYFRKDQPLKAIDHLKRAVAFNPRWDGGFKTLGEVQLSVNRYNDAINSFNQAIRINPRYTEAYYFMGLALKKKNQPAQAQKIFEQCRKADPKSPFGKKCGELAR